MDNRQNMFENTGYTPSTVSGVELVKGLDGRLRPVTLPQPNREPSIKEQPKPEKKLPRYSKATKALIGGMVVAGLVAAPVAHMGAERLTNWITDLNPLWPDEDITDSQLHEDLGKTVDEMRKNTTDFIGGLF